MVDMSQNKKPSYIYVGFNDDQLLLHKAAKGSNIPYVKSLYFAYLQRVLRPCEMKCSYEVNPLPIFAAV